MRRRFYYDRDLDAVLEYGGNYFEEKPRGPAVISDDVGAGVNGLRHMPSGRYLDSKSAHRKENKRRGLEEVGNQTDFASKREKPRADFYGSRAKDAIEQIEGNYNGTAERLMRDRERAERR
ncbi:hypothetical protein UFOVP1603_24 [uncultured Caudovirales phage]|uniref:Uncharacterized protein n=3 Tax=uncultured Caudovirales phage TaxID=2100421 RepID=A0A6J5SS85_9CAUD|nr:hypothetical protein UFOVP1603_24 [uncultured Caudovirales phage]